MKKYFHKNVSVYVFEYKRTGPEIFRRFESRMEEGIVGNLKIRKECRAFVYTKSIHH